MEASNAILFVEDSDPDFYLFAAALHRIGLTCRLVRVEDGLEAAEYLSGRNGFTDRARYPLPGLIITDLKMPRMNGFELLEWLACSGFRHIPVAVFSGCDNATDRERSIQLGACAFYGKPTSMPALDAIARSVGEKWVALQGSAPLPAWIPTLSHQALPNARGSA